MMRRYVLSLLILLSLALVARIGLSLTQHSHASRAEAALSVPPVHAGEVSGQAQQSPSAPGQGDGSVSLIGTAEASVFPGVPGQSVTASELEVLSNLRQMKAKLDQRAKALDAREKAAEETEAKAAPMIELMDLQTTVMLLSRMDQRKVGKILSYMPAEKATQISEALTERIASLQGKK